MFLTDKRSYYDFPIQCNKFILLLRVSFWETWMTVSLAIFVSLVTFPPDLFKYVLLFINLTFCIPPSKYITVPICGLVGKIGCAVWDESTPTAGISKLFAFPVASEFSENCITKLWYLQPYPIVNKASVSLSLCHIIVPFRIFTVLGLTSFIRSFIFSFIPVWLFLLAYLFIRGKNKGNFK